MAEKHNRLTKGFETLYKSTWNTSTCELLLRFTCIQGTMLVVRQWLRLTFFNCCWPLRCPLNRKHLLTGHRLYYHT